MSAQRYVAYETWWNREKGPYALVEEGIQAGEFPEGAKCVSYTETGTRPFVADHQWIGIQFPSAKAATNWITQGEDDTEYQRFSRKSDLDDYLNDVSTSAYLHLGV